MTRSTYKPPGAYPGLSLEEYLAITDRDGWPAVSNTLLRAVGLGPRECQHRQRFGIEPTPSIKIGSLTHTRILDPRRYLDRIVEWKEPVLEPRPALKWDKVSREHYVTSCGRYELNETVGLWRAAFHGALLPEQLSTVTAAKSACRAHYERTVPRQQKLDDSGNPKLAPQNPNSAAYKAFIEANPGREIVTRADIDRAERIANAVRDNPEARRRLGEMWRTEYTIVWEDPETGALMKCRHDGLTDPRGRLVTLLELKTCRDAEEGAFNRQAASLEYHGQAAHYRDGFRAHFGHDRTESICLAVANSGSHDSCVYTWDPGPGRELEAGAKLNAERLQQLLEWRDDYGTGQWPGRRDAALFDFEAHGKGRLLGEENDHGGLDLSGVERRGEEN